MTKENKELLWKLIKEPLRLVVLGVVSFLIMLATNSDWSYAPMALIVLRLLDKWIHEIGKSVESDSLTLGITRF